MAPAVIRTAGAGAFTPDRPVVLRPLPDGRARIGWTGSADATSPLHARITTIGADGTPVGPDLVHAGTELRAMDVRADGVTAAVVVVGDAGAQDGVLARWDASLVPASDVNLMRTGNMQVCHMNSDRPKRARVLWNGTAWAVLAEGGGCWDTLPYSADHLLFVDDSGVPTWRSSWGVSVSLDVRLAFNAANTQSLGLGNCYPGGIGWSASGVLFPMTSACGSAGIGGTLGGLVAFSDGFGLTLSARDDVSGLFRVHYVEFAHNTAPRVSVVLPAAASATAQAPHLVAYEGALLAMWSTDNGLSQVAMRITRAGDVISAPEPLPAPLGPVDDVAALPNGDVAWAYAVDGASSLQVVRVRACD